jgi:hypothetical protein
MIKSSVKPSSARGSGEAPHGTMIRMRHIADAYAWNHQLSEKGRLIYTNAGGAAAKRMSDSPGVHQAPILATSSATTGRSKPIGVGVLPSTWQGRSFRVVWVATNRVVDYSTRSPLGGTLL